MRVYKGEARLAGPGHVEFREEKLEAERIVIATGSDSKIPPIPGLAEAGYWTNREATTLTQIPVTGVSKAVTCSRRVWREPGGAR